MTFAAAGLAFLLLAAGGQDGSHAEAARLLEMMRAANETITDMKCTFTFEVTKQGKAYPPYRTILRYRKNPETVHLTFTDRARGRKVLYVKDQNGGRMRVRPDGFWSFTVVSVDPQGERAMEEAIDPITAQGFPNIVAAAEEILLRAAGSEDCELTVDWDAEAESGPFIRLRICGPGIGEMTMLVDRNTGFPRRITKRNGNSAAVYTYEDIQLNPGMKDPEFSLARNR